MLMYVLLITFIKTRGSTGADPGFVVRGGVSRRGVWGWSPAGPGQSTGRGHRGGAKPPGSSGSLRNYRHLFERQF